MHFNILTYNVMAPVAPPLRFNGQVERMQRIPGALRPHLEEHEVDCVVVQESIVPSQHEILTCGFQKEGFSFHTDPLSGKLLNLKLVDGGVCIFSKYPILKQHQHVFQECECETSDCLAAKGFVYARVDKLGQIFHIVGTHFQAWSTPKTQKIRECQAQSIATFLEKLQPGPQEPVFVVGDFNADWYAQPLHRDRLLRIMNIRKPQFHSASIPFTSDPMTNQLMGNDEDSAYANLDYPKGCYEEYMKTLHCSCCPPEWLDYVTIWLEGRQPEWNHSYLRAIPLKAKRSFHMKLNLTTTRAMRDYSDHFPVVFHGDFPGLKPLRAKLDNPPVHKLHGWSWKWILVIGVFLVVLLTIVLTVVLINRK